MASQPPSSIPSETSTSSTSETSAQTKRSSHDWQERLLPTMTGILVGLTIFFFVTTFIQLAYLNWNILQIPDIELRSPGSASPIQESMSTEEQMAARKLEYLTTLEAYVVVRRYHQAGVSLISNLWLRYLGFTTGMILALVGASFILGKLQEPLSEIAGKWSAMDFSLKSASPGIILAVLGVILMFATIVDRDEVAVQDARIYLTSPDLVSAPNPSAIPILKPLTTSTPSLPSAAPTLGK
ncbi:MAG: hypothetical protein HY868_23400 [Chloroflexi bacterium]|nr:hypothetical protein [Chloroflexota bacterium]